jgi:glucokinase
VKPAELVLAADVGGTKTDIAVFSTAAGVRAPLARAIFTNHHYTGAEAIAREFLDRTKLSVIAACFDVAGPVVDGQARLTNLAWVVKEEALKDALRLHAVHLLNDLEATALAVPSLEPGELHPLSPGKAAPQGAIAVIAPGTGLGEAFLTWDGARYRAHASEGGHADFGPTTPEQIGLLAYLRERFEHVSYELVCSGVGIPHLYAYLKDLGHASELPDVAARLAAADDATPIIIEAALAMRGRSELCASTLDVFASILGAESGNLALKVLATGGMFVAGGIPPRILRLLDRGGFLQAFRDKGRLGGVLAGIPVRVILSPAALMGSASFALELANHTRL